MHDIAIHPACTRITALVLPNTPWHQFKLQPVMHATNLSSEDVAWLQLNKGDAVQITLCSYILPSCKESRQ